MRESTKLIICYVGAIFVLVFMAVDLANAQDSSTVIEVTPVEDEAELVVLDQAELDQLLAPIALYPDSLLSHVLVASTYPLEIIQAARWRENNSELDAEEAREAVEDKDWDPSVKALVPFNDLLQKLSEDLDWTQRLGEAFLLNEEQLLTSVQTLRQKAYEQGSLTDNEYIEVVEDDDDIIIQSVEKEVVYVPYYDTRIVYGPWWWNSHPPTYWHRPHHYYLSAGFYWSPQVFIHPTYYFGGFRWHNRHVIVNHHYYGGHRYSDRYRRVHVREYQRWNHDRNHRRGVRYRHNAHSVYAQNKKRKVNIRRDYKDQRTHKQARVVSFNAKRHNDNHAIKKANNVKQRLTRNDYTRVGDASRKGNRRVNQATTQSRIKQNTRATSMANKKRNKTAADYAKPKHTSRARNKANDIKHSSRVKNKASDAKHSTRQNNKGYVKTQTNNKRRNTARQNNKAAQHTKPKRQQQNRYSAPKVKQRTEPRYRAPSKPAYQTPSKPVYRAPSKPAYQAPSRPAYSGQPKNNYKANRSQNYSSAKRTTRSHSGSRNKGSSARQKNK